MVRFIRRKSLAAPCVKEMISEIENLFNEKIDNLLIVNRPKVKWLRSDGGGEYISRELTSWLREKGIVQEMKTAYSPE